MARLPRFVLPGFPQHVIQRGNSRQQILFVEEDYWYLWEKIAAAANKFQCQVHAYVLMPNHFHLLLTPLEEESIRKLMQYVGRYYVQFFNARYDRTGTLWEGRYRATLVDPDQMLLPVSHYLESNPVRAGLVDHPSRYGWSSYGANATGTEDPLVTPHAVYQKLGRSLKARHNAYTKGAENPPDEALLARIRDATNKAWVLGDSKFCHAMEQRVNRRTMPRSRGGDRRSEAYRRATGRL